VRALYTVVCCANFVATTAGQLIPLIREVSCGTRMLGNFNGGGPIMTLNQVKLIEGCICVTVGVFTNSMTCCKDSFYGVLNVRSKRYNCISVQNLKTQSISKEVSNQMLICVIITIRSMLHRMTISY
jgi:hypothetical protein